ncbi:calcium-transporting ATPase 2, plasma membrane-type-like protein [Tanacetum coccineum]
MTFIGVVLELLGGGVRAHCKGASEIVLAACDKVINENALGTLCLAYIDLESGVSAETHSIVRSTGITFRMVTIDNITTAKSIARECGILIDDGIAINGADFCEKSLEVLLIIIPNIQVVAVTGDGTNDSLSLHEAIIRLSIGIGALLELRLAFAPTKPQSERHQMAQPLAGVIGLTNWNEALEIITYGSHEQCDSWIDERIVTSWNPFDVTAAYLNFGENSGGAVR